MEVILLERIEKLGQMGDVVKVKPGYARNFLLPQNKALRATKHNVEQFEGQRAQLEATNLERRKDARSIAGKFDDVTCVLLRQASESAQLYGSVSARDVAEAVGEQGINVTRSQVLLDRPIKTLGIHAVRIMLHPEVMVGISVNVARSVEEAEAQAAARKAGEPGEAEAAGEEAADESAAPAAPAAPAAVETETAQEISEQGESAP